MKLSEAILKGCNGTHQHFGGWTDGQGGACVMEAARKAVGVNHENFNKYFPTADFVHALGCPIEGCEMAKQLHVLAHLNDHHRWTRERIAYWVRDTFEQETGATLVTKEVKEEEMVHV